METLIIEKNKYQPESYDLMKWVMNARVADKDSRTGSVSNALKMVMISKNRVVCTDGHRLHSFRHGRTYQPGVYQVVSQDKKSIVLGKDETGIVYPDVKQVVRIKGAKKVVSIDHNGRINIAGPFTQMVRAMESGTISLDYFQDAITEGQWRIKITPEGPVRFDNCNKMALIMPMRI